MDKIKIRWHIKNHTSFYGEHEGFTISVDKAKWWLWNIKKDGVIIDTCLCHSPTYDELSAKIQAEKSLNKIFEQWIK